MQGEAQDIHESGGAGMGQLFQDCVEEIQSLLCVLIFIPLCSLTSIAHFALLQHWTYQIKRSKMHPFMFLSSICSKQFQEVVQVLLVLCEFPPAWALPWNGEQGAATASTDGIWTGLLCVPSSNSSGSLLDCFSHKYMQFISVLFLFCCFFSSDIWVSQLGCWLSFWLLVAHRWEGDGL